MELKMKENETARVCPHLRTSKSVKSARCKVSPLSHYISLEITTSNATRKPISQNSYCEHNIYDIGANKKKKKKEIYIYISSVLSPRICFCFVNPISLAGRAAFFANLRLAISKHDLKASGTFFRKFACDLEFAGTVFIGLLPLEGD